MSNSKPPTLISRRNFVQTAAAASVVLSASQLTGERYGSSRQFAYVGTYTGNGQGIYLYQANEFTGELTLVKLAANTVNPSFLAADRAGKFLYAVNEISNFQGGVTGSVTSFAVHPSTGDLNLVSAVSSGGSGPVYISLDATGKFLFVSNYGDGSIAVLPVFAGGVLGAPIDIHQDVGNVGPAKATNAPPGSFAVSGHDAPHAHQIIAAPGNKFVLQTDLGQDRIYVYAFNSSTGRLTPAGIPFVSLPPGDGPRHIAFHPNGLWLYCITEEASTLTVFRFNDRTGELTSRQTISALPPNFAGTSFGSEVKVSADGRFVYAANRLEDGITTFFVRPDGELIYIGVGQTRGDYPRQFTIDPRGNYLYSCNQRSDNLTSFRIDPFTGVPRPTGQYAAVGTPACIIFLP